MRGYRLSILSNVLGAFWVAFGLVCVVLFALGLAESLVSGKVGSPLDCGLGLLLGIILILGGIGFLRGTKWGRLTLIFVLPAVGYWALTLSALFLFKGLRVFHAACCGLVVAVAIATWILALIFERINKRSTIIMRNGAPPQ